MEKETLLRYLQILETSLKDFDVAEAILLLKEKVQSLPASNVSVEGKNEFTLPEELAGLNVVALFCDGGCRGNPGPGAFAAIGQDKNGKIIFEDIGSEISTTNNRMELLGAISALTHALQFKDGEVVLFCDSRYVIDGLGSWLKNWKARGWKKADNKEPENLDLWKRLSELVDLFSHLSLRWVRGHAGHLQNEYCDKLVNQELDILQIR